MQPETPQKEKKKNPKKALTDAEGCGILLVLPDGIKKIISHQTLL